ncbi:hypothetical protein DAPPUDRAFT_309096 [Daphnia pulex]|uniref:Uncharacterized protein n=1 Tax=Daphnia pulex TaxID=6669 RepID=E9G3R6_DAPPU|nr:hypothetical protein DAPPUDRAFT_309096 [Daphnia pulex]|eukprot:EFX85812.1 hypothetical protein DAPPUDRAFT_309096 [Daphnia pulex]
MSIVSLLFFIGLQVNLSIAVPVFRDAASMAFAIQHQPELFRLEAAQPTGLRAESTLVVPSVNSNFLLNLQYLSGLLNSLSTLLGQSPAPPATDAPTPATDTPTPASGPSNAPPPPPPSRAVGANLGQGRVIPSQADQKTLFSLPGLGGLFQEGAIDFRGLPVAQLG